MSKDRKKPLAGRPQAPVNILWGRYDPPPAVLVMAPSPRNQRPRWNFNGSGARRKRATLQGQTTVGCFGRPSCHKLRSVHGIEKGESRRVGHRPFQKERNRNGRRGELEERNEHQKKRYASEVRRYIGSTGVPSQSSSLAR